MKATPRKEKLTDQIRLAVRRSGQTRYRISKATGISESSLCLLVGGRRFITPEALDRLAGYLGLEVVAKRPPKRKAGEQ